MVRGGQTSTTTDNKGTDLWGLPPHKYWTKSTIIRYNKLLPLVLLGLNMCKVMEQHKTENEKYLHEQLITYIGNKRALLPFIGQVVDIVRSELGKERLSCLDIFSGSGIVARYLKQYASSISVNDLERYSQIINQCYLSNCTESELENLHEIYKDLIKKINLQIAVQNQNSECPGFISELYAPSDMDNITISDRCFYTKHNANYIDIARQLIESEVPENLRSFFIAPLLSEASIHANTAGIFKGFYKNSKTKTGQFGGNGKNALSRILGKIELQFPVLSEFSCPYYIFNEDANTLVNNPELYTGCDGCFDLAYFDPPYNQHPYGSNYFMLNLIADYERPDVDKISRVSGIPKDWNRSAYNKRKQVSEVFFNLVNNVKARYVLVSFNSEGFISRDEMIDLLSKCGEVQVLESKYNTFRGSRNLNDREIHVKEYLFLVHKKIFC